jgi:hypothetical protein
MISEIGIIGKKMTQFYRTFFQRFFGVFREHKDDVSEFGNRSVSTLRVISKIIIKDNISYSAKH